MDGSPMRERDENQESLKKYTKQKHTIEVKLECIKRIELGAKVKELSQELGVTPPTVRSWIKNKESLESRDKRHHTLSSEMTPKRERDSTTPNGTDVTPNGNVLSPPGSDSTPKSKPKPRPRPKPQMERSFSLPQPRTDMGREPDIPQLVNNALLKWYEACQQKGYPVTRERFEAKTAYYFKRYGVENFYMTNEWLSKWMKQHSFKLLPERIDSIDINQISDADVQTELNLQFRCGDYQRCQIFNCSVIAWHYKALPLSLGYLVERNYPQEDFMKVYSFANADMSLKIPLICTVNTGKRKFWKNEFNIPLYSTDMDFDKLDTTIFSHFLSQEFIPHVTKFLLDRKLPPKVLLILDDELFEVSQLDYGAMKSVLVSKSVTFLVRPFDTELVPLMKSCKHSFLKKVNNMIRENSSVPLVQHLDNINNGHFLAWIKMHWVRGPDSFSDLTDIQLVRSLPGAKDLSFDTVDMWLKRCHPEVIEKNEALPVKIKSENDPDVISTDEATDYLNKLIAYFNFHNTLDSNEMMILNSAKQRVIEMAKIV